MSLYSALYCHLAALWSCMQWSWLIAWKFANFANWICRLLRLSRRMLGLLVVLYRILTICKWRWSHSSKSITLKLMHVLVQPRLSYDHFTGPIIIFFLRDYHQVSWVHDTTCSNSIIGLDQVSDLYVIIQQIDTLPCDRNKVGSTEVLALATCSWKAPDAAPISRAGSCIQTQVPLIRHAAVPNSCWAAQLNKRVLITSWSSNPTP